MRFPKGQALSGGGSIRFANLYRKEELRHHV